jgi:hypothetical protein
MEADKLGGYTVKEWRQMIEDKVVADISDEVLEFVKPNIFEKNAQNKEARKESVTEELYYVRNEGFLGNALLWWTKGCNGYTCDINDAHSLRENKQKKLVKTSRFSLPLYVHRRTRESQKSDNRFSIRR